MLHLYTQRGRDRGRLPGPWRRPWPRGSRRRRGRRVGLPATGPRRPGPGPGFAFSCATRERDSCGGSELRGHEQRRLHAHEAAVKDMAVKEAAVIRTRPRGAVERGRGHTEAPRRINLYGFRDGFRDVRIPRCFAVHRVPQSHRGTATATHCHRDTVSPPRMIRAPTCLMTSLRPRQVLCVKPWSCESSHIRHVLCVKRRSDAGPRRCIAPPRVSARVR